MDSPRPTDAPYGGFGLQGLAVPQGQSGFRVQGEDQGRSEGLGHGLEGWRSGPFRFVDRGQGLGADRVGSERIGSDRTADAPEGKHGVPRLCTGRNSSYDLIILELAVGDGVGVGVGVKFWDRASDLEYGVARNDAAGAERAVVLLLADHCEREVRWGLDVGLGLGLRLRLRLVRRPLSARFFFFRRMTAKGFGPRVAGGVGLGSEFHHVVTSGTLVPNPRPNPNSERFPIPLCSFRWC